MDLKNFLEVEKKYNLYNDTIQGVNYWVYSRFLIWNEIILKQKIGLAKAHNLPNKKFLDKCILYCKLFKNTITPKKFPSKPVSICFMNHSRRVKNNDYYECIYTDALAALYPDSVVLEHPYQLTHLTPVHTQNLIYIDDTAVKGNLFYVIYKKIHRRKYIDLLKEIESRITLPINELEKLYCMSLDLHQVCALIAKQILIYKGKYPYFVKLICKINPKLLIEVVHYDMDCMIVNEICYEKGITTIELQHGMMNNHVAYQYNTLTEITQFPQKIFLFSEYWKNCIHLPISDVNIIATGYPYFERKKKETNFKEIYTDNKINILFISQGTIGGKLSKLATELAEKLSPEKYRIIYKLHPGEIAVWETQYSYLKNTAIQVIDKNDYSLYDYFKNSSIQVGVYSTALYEGIGFGLLTYIYNIEAANCMKDLCSSGLACYIKDSDDLCKKLQDTVVDSQISNTLWKPNALENMQQEIKKCLKEKDSKGSGKHQK